MAGRISDFIASWFSLVIIDERHDNTVKLAMICYCDQNFGHTALKIYPNPKTNP